jgi:hypothetical protein
VGAAFRRPWQPPQRSAGSEATNASIFSTRQGEADRLLLSEIHREYRLNSSRRFLRSTSPLLPQRAALVAVGRAAAGAAVEAANADTAVMSCTDMLVTIGFMSSAHGPRRAPVFMSKSCRMV